MTEAPPFIRVIKPRNGNNLRQLKLTKVGIYNKTNADEVFFPSFIFIIIETSRKKFLYLKANFQTLGKISVIQNDDSQMVDQGDEIEIASS
jgi:hypothetical protein